MTEKSGQRPIKAKLSFKEEQELYRAGYYEAARIAELALREVKQPAMNEDDEDLERKLWINTGFMAFQHELEEKRVDALRRKFLGE